MRKLAKLAVVFFVMLFLTFACTRIVKGIIFDRECGGYLKQAADANTIELAHKRLSIAIASLEKNNTTSGYTSIFYRTPDEDIDFWYTNLKTSLQELQEELQRESQIIDSLPTKLEKSNMLIKLGETLIDHTKNGVDITCPNGISIFPNNVLYTLWGWGSFLFSFFGIWFLITTQDEW